MATKNLVPRNDGEGRLGTDSKRWESIAATHITASGNISSSGVGHFTMYGIVATHITASGNISASGTIYASNFESPGSTSVGISDDLSVTGNISASGWITASRLTTYDDITLKDGYGAGDTLVKIYDSSNDGIIDVYRNNSVTNRIHGNGISYFNSAGVAIGTTVTGSGAKLTVEGSISASGNITASGTLIGSNLSGTNTGDQTLAGLGGFASGSNDNFVTDAQLVVVGNTSGTNTGDQNLLPYMLGADTGSMNNLTVTGATVLEGTLTVNGTRISASGDISASNLSGTNTGDNAINTNYFISGSEDNFVTDAQLVVVENTSGANTGDKTLEQLGGFTSGSQDNFVSDAQLVVIGNTAGTNTGDQNLSSYLQNSDTGSFGDITSTGDISASAFLTHGDISASGGLIVEGSNVDFNDLPSVKHSWLSTGNLYTQSGSQLPFSGSTAEMNNISASKFVLIK